MKYKTEIKSLLDVACFSPNSIEAPFAWVGHLPFAYWIMKEVSPKVFVELGTHSGNSYFTFCQSVKEAGLSTKCYSVDTWKGDEHALKYGEDIYNKVSSYNLEKYKNFSNLLRMTFDDALMHFEDQSIDILHIDGFHTYEAVKHDFESWLPKLAPSAIVIFHDTVVKERDFGVWKLWDELVLKYPNHLNFEHSFGLGIIQISNRKDRSFEWLESDSEVQKIVINYFANLGKILFGKNDITVKAKSFETQLNKTQEELKDLQCKLNKSEKAIESLKSSISWKVTSPFRFFYDKFQ